jgi:hypothetical protein
VMEKIDAVRSDEMLELARELIREDRLSLALVGPYDDIEHFRSQLKF